MSLLSYRLLNHDEVSLIVSFQFSYRKRLTECVHLYESTKHKTPDDSFFINPITKQHLRCNLIIDNKSANHQVSSSEFSSQESAKNLDVICGAFSKYLQSDISPSNIGENTYWNCIGSLSFVRSSLTSSSSVLLRFGVVDTCDIICWTFEPFSQECLSCDT